MYQKTDCPKHGNWQYKTRYQSGCSECFVLLLKEFEDYKELFRKTNSERAQVICERDRLKKVLGERFVEELLKKL